MKHLSTVIAATAISAFAVHTPESAEVSFKGQTISVVIGYGVGGGYDIYGRIVARFLGKYLPGNPTVVAQNMTGAGSLRAAEYLYNKAPKDGTALGVIGQTIPVDQLLDAHPKNFKSEKFTWIGRMAAGTETIAVWHTSAVQSMEQAKSKVAAIAATGPSSGSAIYPTVLNNLIGTKFKVVSGYAGTKEMLLAMERGETDGCGAINASTLTSEFANWLTDKKMKVLTQVSLHRHPAFPDSPTLVDLATNDQDKQIMKLFAASGDIGRALLAPPGLQPETAAALRKAFTRMMKDPELLAMAEKNKLDVSPLDGEELQSLVADIGGTEPNIIKRAAAAKTPKAD